MRFACYCQLSIWSVIVLKCLFVLLHDKKMGIYALIYVLRACRYIEDDEGIRKYFAAFHLLGSFPAAVIIDDFADFFSERCVFNFVLSSCLIILDFFFGLNNLS